MSALLPNIDAVALRKNPLFTGLSDTQWASVIEHIRTHSLAEGDTLFEHGQPAARFFQLRQGQIKLYRLSIDGDEKVIEIIRPGQTFAEAVMFMEHNDYPVSAQALVPSKLISFDNELFLSLLRESVDTCFRLMGDMSRRLHSRLNEIDSLTLQNATFRLIHYLLNQLPEGALQDCDIQLGAAKNVIASRLSIKPETLSRILNNLSKAGILQVKGPLIHINDIDKLREYVQQ